ncbi:hypothetical protein CALCODRAFT_478935 [Calocera cornea HHB12733]|uniref:Uncharacterized protein n=1 Tax=Calocera cornea HHB12733 TaxID=1353952 RepID=A0A165K3P2_9BASI|nr:hypothetical protein CALCODRAFT_478935 [Calocera cornea HHB12733]
MVATGLPTRFVPSTGGGWTLADGWVLHGKSFDQRDGTEGYDPDSDPSSIADGSGEDDSSTIPLGDNLSDTGDVGGSASNSTNVGAIDSAVASVAASATAVLSPTTTSVSAASGTGVVAGHSNVGASTSTSTSSTPSYSPTDLPTGWEPGPSRTAYYEVPLIISMALLLTVFIVGTIAACVWRNQKKKKKLARARAAKLADDGGSMDGEIWPDLERLRRAAVKDLEKKRRKEERESLPRMRAWLGAESKWRARLMLRKRGGRRRRTGGEEREKDADSAVSTSIDGSRPSGTFVRSAAPSPSPHMSNADAAASAPTDTTISGASHLPHTSARFPPSASSSRAPSPSPSTSPARPPSYLAMSDEHDELIASTSTAPIRQMYPDLPPSPPTPPPGLRTMVIPSRAHIATDDKRVLARMGRPTFPRSSMDEAGPVPDVPEWTDEEPPFATDLSHHPPPHPDEREENYVPQPPRSIAPEDEMFAFSGSNLPAPPPAFQHAVDLDPAVPFDPGLAYGSHSGEPVASAPYEEWDEYGDASAPPLEDEDDLPHDTLEQERDTTEGREAAVRR